LKFLNFVNINNKGYDPFALEDEGVIRPGERVMVKTGISIATPVGYYGRVSPPPGHARKTELMFWLE
jgi:dUTPase